MSTSAALWARGAEGRARYWRHGYMLPGRVALGLWLALSGMSLACEDESDAAEDSPAPANDGDAEAGAVAGADYDALPRSIDPSDRAQTVLASGMTVSTIVLERYGNRHYTRAVLIHNDIRDASRLPIGKRIETPPIETIMREYPGLRRRIGDEVEVLIDARRVLMGMESELHAETDEDPDRMQVEVGPKTAAKLDAFATRIQDIAESLAQPRPETQAPPEKMVASLLEAATIARRVAQGEVLDETFEVDQFHQCLGNAMADALIWARVDFR